MRRILSGMRPTGALHFGHYFGVLKNWLELQQHPETECFFFTADWHALTTKYQEEHDIAACRFLMLVDWLSVGLDPQRAVFFAQSAILEQSELSTLLGMITPVPWLERVPSYKELRTQLREHDLSTIGFLNYPVLMTADIALYRATHVPVGEDQLAHVEIAREIVRRFNHYFGGAQAETNNSREQAEPLLKEPQALLTPTPRLLGLDGRKMSKSYDNALYLGEPEESLVKKIMPAPTDPARVKRSDPGTPENCNIYAYHRLFTDEPLPDPQTLPTAEIAAGCRSAGIGCVDCKKHLLKKIQSFRAPILAKRHEILKQPDYVQQILNTGNQQAQSMAAKTMSSVRKAMSL